MTVQERLAKISKKLDKLIELDGCTQSIFGANDHNYILNATLTEQQISNFEKDKKITLPVEYRKFLQDICDGGAGPFYGLLALENNGEFEIDLSQEFPYDRDNPLNLLQIMESTDFANIDDAEIDNYLQQYYDNTLRGIKVICHEGCGMYSVLVVNGKEKGNMWYLDFSNDVGAFPYINLNNKGINFLDWYELWLDHALNAKENNGEELSSYSNYIS